MSRRFLLDQNFPNPISEVIERDTRFQITSLSSFDSTLSNERTPDWLLFLRAAEGEFDGVVTRDRSQLSAIETMVVLVDTRLSVVTWHKGLDDSIREWGQLIAFLPDVCKKMDSGHRGIFTIPTPRIAFAKAMDPIGIEAGGQGQSNAQLLHEARRSLKASLDKRRLPKLKSLLR